eukprot:401983_1
MEIDLIIDSISSCESLAESIFDLVNTCFDTEWKRYVLIFCKIIGLILDIVSLAILASSDMWPAAVYFGIVVGIDRVCIIILITITYCHDHVIWNPSQNSHYKRYVTKMTNWRRNTCIEKKQEFTKQNEESFKYGLISSWYGSMFNYTDFAARLWLIDETVVLGLSGISYIVCAFLQGIFIFCYLLNVVMFSSNIGETKFERNPSLFALCLNIFVVVLSGVGVLQHCVLIGNAYSTKSYVKIRRDEAIQQLKNEKSLLSNSNKSTSDHQNGESEFDEDQITAKIIANITDEYENIINGTITLEERTEKYNNENAETIQTCCQ